MNATPPLIASISLLLCISTLSAGPDWCSWRGPTQHGVASEPNLPTTWSATQNVTWKAPLPAPGNSTPIVHGDRIFLTSASVDGSVRSVLCFGRDGSPRWQRDTKFSGKEPTHETNPYGSPSPVTDGQRVYAWLGSAGVVAYTADGEALWHRDLGPVRHIWGVGSSPVLHGDKLILNFGPGPASRLIALDAGTGKTLWENELPEARGKSPEEWKGSWSTPVIHPPAASPDSPDAAGVPPLIILSLPQYVAGIDLATGKERWRCRGLSDLVYTNPVIGNGVIVAMSGYQGPALAMRLPAADEQGDLTDSHRLWREERAQQRIGSGVIAGDHFYLVNEPGIGQCIELKTGKTLWRQRVAGSTWSSSVLAGDKIYVTAQSGETIVFRATPEKLDVLHRNELDEPTRASIAVSDGQLFIRTHKHLYCIGSRRQP